MSDIAPHALGPLLALLEGRFALRVLWALRDGQPRTFRVLQECIGAITPNTLNTRIKELRKAALLTHAGKGYLLTALGLQLLQTFGDLPGFAQQWSSIAGTSLPQTITT